MSRIDPSPRALQSLLAAQAWELSRSLRAWAAALSLSLRGPVSADVEHDLPGELIVSLTSYPARFRTLDLTLKSLLSQSMRPDRVLLWVGHAALDQLPRSVTRLSDFGLEIRATEDIGPYTKVIPTLRAFPDAFVVTADDDIFYDREWLAGLVRAFDPATPQIISYRAHLPRFEPDGTLSPYHTWEWEAQRPHGSEVLFPTGVGGVLYAPNALGPEVLNQELFKRLCPQADDVWLYFMGRRSGASYRTVGRRFRALNWPLSQRTSLWSRNLSSEGNDVQIQRMQEHFGLLQAGRPAGTA